MINIFHIDNLN